MSNRPRFSKSLRKYLSTRQKVNIVVTFVGVFLIALAISRIILPHLDDNKRYLVAFIASLSRNIIMILYERLIKKPAGKFYTAILSPEGVRGEFCLGQNWAVRLVSIGIITPMFVVIQTINPFIRLFIAVVVISALVSVYYLALAGRFNSVIALRVDDEGNVSFRRHDEDWQPLILTKYHKIRLM